MGETNGGQQKWGQPWRPVCQAEGSLSLIGMGPRLPGFCVQLKIITCKLYGKAERRGTQADLCL